MKTAFLGILLACSITVRASGEEASIRLNLRGRGHPVSPYMAGACIEDVNHEVYGGIYSQMVFGESFQEPATTSPVKGFVAFGGEWTAEQGELRAGGGQGPRLVSSADAFTSGEAGAEVFLPGGEAGNAGLIVRVGRDRAGVGADPFDGYEVSIDAARKLLVLGRHRHDFRLLKEAPCDVGPDRWVALAVKLADRTITVSVDGKPVLEFTDDRPLNAGTVGLRQWQRPARYRNLWVKPEGGTRVDLPFEPARKEAVAVSGMWAPMRKGSAVLAAEVVSDKPFVGTQSQRLTFVEGAGEVGVENQGLNRWGMAFVAGKPYEGYVWLRAEKPAEAFVSIESRDGARRYADTRLEVKENEWRRFDFTLTPNAADAHGRFAVTLKSPGSVVVGHAFLQPGEWGRFEGLPLRKDVVEGLIDQGVRVLRYGGSMVNAPEYRWKKMTGPRDRRPSYRGTWYPYSTNGWGIPDFLDLCDAAGFLAIPDFNIDESPRDMADFVEYANGSLDSEWGRRRAADGHPKPYGLKYIELGNEERVDDAYCAKFAAIAEAVWAKDPQITLVVGDFAYDRPIDDPMRFTGSASGVTSLAAHRKILELARRHDREVWFDVHVGTEGPAASTSLMALPTFIDALEKISGGAKHKVVVFELNANNHAQRRALANAQAVGTITRDGRLPVVTSANCLQPDGQNDNGWDQGLLFLNPTKVWLQPPGYVTQLVARHDLARTADVDVKGGGDWLDATATRSVDGKRLTLRVVNLSDQSRPAKVQFEGFTPSKPVAESVELSAPLDARNTADQPERVKPVRGEWRHGADEPYSFPPHSVTVLSFQ